VEDSTAVTGARGIIGLRAVIQPNPEGAGRLADYGAENSRMVNDEEWIG
jgi:hypothetical protein